MKSAIMALVLLASATAAHGQPRTPLTRALADALYCPLATCMTTATGDVRYLKIAADNDPLTGQLNLASSGLSFPGATSGTTSLVATAIAGTTALTLPAATDTLVGKATTDTFTNKSIALGSNTVTGTTAQFNTALSDNDFATLAGSEGLTNKTLTSPILVTPTLGVATATSINKVAVTAPASSATLTIADGKTLTASNSLTLAGTDATTITFQGTDTYVGRTTTDTLTNKTLTSPAMTGPTTNTLQTSGNIGVGGSPSGTTGDGISNQFSGNFGARIITTNTDAASTGSFASFRTVASTAIGSFIAYGAAYSTSGFGVTLGNWVSAIATAGNGLIVGTNNAAPMHLGTSSVMRLSIASSGEVTLPAMAVTAGTMTGTTATTEAVVGTTTTCRSWTNAQVVALGATTAGDIAYGTLPANSVVLNAYIKITGAASGPTTVTVSLGRTSASYIDYIVASDAKAAANTVYGDASAERGTNLTGYDLPSVTGTTVVNAHFVSTAANLSTVTGSTGTVCMTIGRMPW